MKRGTGERSTKTVRSLLIVLAVLLVPLVAAPVQAKSAADDQYEGRTGVGHDAAADALTASEAFEDDTEDDGSEGSAPPAAEGPPEQGEPGTAAAVEIAHAAISSPEEGVAVDSLPATGGISPLTLGVLVVATGVLTGYVARRALRTR